MDRIKRQTPLPAKAVRSLVHLLDPCSVFDLVLRAIILTGFTCLFRPNSHQSLKWKDITFEAVVDGDGNLVMEVVIVVPDSKAVAYGAAQGRPNRVVKLREFALRELCVVRTLVALGLKMGVFDRGFEAACIQQRFVVKEECSTWFVFPAVEDGVISPLKTVRFWNVHCVCKCFFIFGQAEVTS